MPQPHRPANAAAPAAPATETGRAVRLSLLASSAFLVALCLRPAITSVGPVLPRIGDDLHLGEGALGALGALPLLGFALVSPFVHRLSSRTGPERTLVVALLVLAGGLVVRSCTGGGGLWIGTAIIGCAIAVGNVLGPVVVKRDFATRISPATGIYSACLGGAAALASVSAVPLAGLGGWRLALGVWAVPVAIVALVCAARLRSSRPAPGEPGTQPPTHRTVWSSGTAWLITAFMGVQSTTFFIMITWLPTIETSAGVSATAAGTHLSGLQVMGILSGLAIPLLMRNPATQAAAAITASVPMLVAVLGLLLAPGLSLLWALVAGLGTGASLVVSLSLVSLRGRSHAETTQISGMAQSIGYLMGAAGPAVAGLLAEHTGGWTAALVLVAVLAAVQIAVGAVAGVDRRRTPPPESADRDVRTVSRTVPGPA